MISCNVNRHNGIPFMRDGW